MPDIYSYAWKMLEERIASTRKQSISKADLIGWQLRSLEQAVDRVALEEIYTQMAEQRGEQETTQTPPV